MLLAVNHDVRQTRFLYAMISEVSWSIVCICTRQLTEVTGLSRIGNSLVDDKKNADDETSMSEYICNNFYLRILP